MLSDLPLSPCFHHLFRNRAGDIYSTCSELFVTQHDVLRDLALHIGNREKLNRRNRLIMPKRLDGLPKDWLRNKDGLFDAQIVSIHTGIEFKLFTLCSAYIRLSVVFIGHLLLQNNLDGPEKRKGVFSI